MSSKVSDMVEIGFVARPHGVRGELRVATHDPDSTILLEVDALQLGDATYELARAKAIGGARAYFLIKLRGVDDREAADALRGCAICVTRDALPLLEGEFLLADLVGCLVFREDGAPYGSVAAVDAGPQDRLVIHDGAVERLLPLVPELVLEVDLEARRIVVAPPEGLPESPRES